MTLSEAIKNAEEMAEDKEKVFRLCPYPSEMCNGSHDCRCLKNGAGKGCLKCAAEHRQLVEWLRELKAVQDIIKQHDSDSMPEDYWYIDKIRMEVLE